MTNTEERRPEQDSKVGREDELFFPNDIIIKEIWVFSGPLRKVEVKRLLVGLNIFEDLYSNVITGSLTLVDTIDLIGKFPFVGLEQIKIVFKTPGFPNRPETSLFFDVYNVSERNVGMSGAVTDTTQSYTLQFVSPAYFRNQHNRVMKAYSNEPISTMVQKIAGNILKEDVFAEPSTGFRTFVIPRWTPFRAINWLAARARPETAPHAANYFFFETVDGFQFRSIHDMAKQPPVVRFAYNIANQRPLNGQRDRANYPGSERLLKPEVQMIRSYSILQSGSTMEHIEQGMYASTLITHDIVKKGFDVKRFRYTDNFDLPEMQHTEGQAPHVSTFPGDAKHGTQFNSSVKFYAKHSNSYDGVPDNDESEKWLLERMSQLRQLEAQRVKIRVPGLNFLRVGQMVILDVPAPEPVRNQESLDDSDSRISGNYLVTSIHHIILTDNHEMVVELSKESLLPAEDAGIVEIADAVSSILGTDGVMDDITTGMDIPTLGFA